jgi:hypothetical protein
MTLLSLVSQVTACAFVGPLSFFYREGGTSRLRPVFRTTTVNFFFGARPVVILQPERVPFNGSVLGSAKGTWVISVNAAVYVEGTDNLLLNVTLEKGARAPEGQGATRRLGILVPAPVLKEFCLREGIACDIRQWLEGTEGNGFLDLTRAA